MSDLSWSATKSIRTDPIGVSSDDQNFPSDKSAQPKNDSIATIMCDKYPPYFTDLNPKAEQRGVPRNTIIKFRVNDDFRPKKNEWDRYGVDTSKIFISIKSRFWGIDSVRPNKITLADSIFKVDCEYSSPMPFDWSDTVTVILFAQDVSYLKNQAETSYVFYTLEDSAGPVINPYDPYPDQINVPVDAAVHFWVWDSSGVDVDSVFLDIVSDSVNVSHAKPETTKVAGDTVYFRYQPDRSFAY
ncbi:MAG: hypothetical protein ONB37_02475, partial [candidate division KSB1 bacterium]|nr:hypothetical protein [candidate division KSB1 bacterium]